MAMNGSPELLIVTGPAATPDQTEHVVARLEEAGAQARISCEFAREVRELVALMGKEIG